jgi:hypothetical protein
MVPSPKLELLMGIVVILTIHPVSAKLPVMPSLRQTGSGK